MLGHAMLMVSKLGSFYEGFEDSSNPFNFSGDWVITDGTGFTTKPYKGAKCFTNKNINDSQTSSTSFICGLTGILTLYYAISSETNCDKLSILVNSTIILNGASGNVSWTKLVINVNKGDVVNFQYKKDGSMSKGDDAAFIDEITLVKA